MKRKTPRIISGLRAWRAGDLVTESPDAQDQKYGWVILNEKIPLTEDQANSLIGGLTALQELGVDVVQQKKQKTKK
jgi:hypothetical protein